MYTITTAQAQTIVNRMMKDIPYNINIMNHEGIIIGSGNTNRVGSLHHGAVKAITQGETIEIYQDEEFVKKGINIPIELDGNIIGVVGISGEVDIIRPFGKLLRSAVILLINQIIAIEKETSEQHLKQEFFHLLINTETVYTQQIIQRGLHYSIELTKPAQVIYIENISTLSELELSHKALFKLSPASYCVILQDERAFASLIKDIRIAIPSAYIAISKWNVSIAESYLQAKSAMRILKGLNMDERFIDYANCEFTSDMLRLSRGQLINEHTMQLMKCDDEMIQTLQVYLNCNLNLNETASKLMIHRNTLSYRLNKIHALTGKDPKKFIDRIELIFMLIHHLN